MPPGAYSENPGVTAFAFNVQAAATPLTRDEYIAQQTQYAQTLRTNILADKTASSSLQALAADETNWTALYLQALTEAGLLRAVDEPPAVRDNPLIVGLEETLAAGILAGPAGKQIVTGGDLPTFFAQVESWYAPASTATTPYVSQKTDTVSPHEPTTYYSFDPPPAGYYNLNASAATQYEGFYVYVPWANSWDYPWTFHSNDQTHPENPNFVNVQPTDYSAYFSAAGHAGAAVMTGPLASGADQFVPLKQAEPYTIEFGNSTSATSDVGQITINSKLDSSLDPRSFRLGDITLGDISIHIPGSVGTFEHDYDYTPSKGYILRVTAGIDVSSGTASWLLQAIDPLTGQVIHDPSKGLLPPDNAAGAGRGYVRYTMTPKAGVATGTQITASARVLFNGQAPLDTHTLTYTLDSEPPTTTLSRHQAGYSRRQLQSVQWTSQDNDGGSGVKSVTVFVSTDGGGYQRLEVADDRDVLYLRRRSRPYLQVPGAGYRQCWQQRDAALGLVGSRRRPISQHRRSADGDWHGAKILARRRRRARRRRPIALFVSAEAEIPGVASTKHPAEFSSVLAPFTSQSFATGIAQSDPDIGPLALLALPDGSVLVSGGASRSELYLMSAGGGAVGAPFATLPEPIYGLALDASGKHIWAATGGGPLYELDATTGAVLAEFRRRVDPEPRHRARHGQDLRIVRQGHRGFRPDEPLVLPFQRHQGRQPCFRARRHAVGGDVAAQRDSGHSVLRANLRRK